MNITDASKVYLTEALQNAVNLYLAARVFRETIEPEILALEQDVLNGMNAIEPRFFTVPNRGSFPVLKPGDCMEDDDIQEFCEKKHERLLRMGYKVEKFYCPLLCAQDDERKARRAVINAAVYITDTPAERLVAHPTSTTTWSTWNT